MRFHWWIALICFVLPWPALAMRASYRNAHPIGWMHLLPVGETPGWGLSAAWVDIELNHANIWNMESTYTDSRTGDIYKYKADFEQSSAIVNMGFRLSSTLALGVEVPYANRNGGFLDDFIDQFHQVIDSDRFLRHLNDDFGNSFVVQKNGEDMLASERGQGLGGTKVKLKWWPLQWRSVTPGVCDCGVSFSLQAKFPTQARKFGLSSGNNDYSGLMHMGAPIGKYSAVWATGAVTKLGPNDTFGDWPRREWLQMYELSLDVGFGPSFGILLQARTESPLFMQEHMDFNYTQSDEDARVGERIASGWNSLTAWRGSQVLGARWRWGQGSQVNFMIVEDWGTGHRDQRKDFLYVNNAPDVAFVSQWHFVF
jgi:hypothetical protein